MANEISTTHTQSSSDASVLGSFEEKIKDFQQDLKGLVSCENLDELKTKWNDLSSKTVSEIDEHPLQMVALAGMLGFSLGVAGKRVDFRQLSSRTLDWAAKLGASWAVDKLSDGKSTGKSVH